ncbi:MAG: DUF512 domain-containing protein [Thermodesulfobacteriota bacterium]|jgi:putative radical SAM enzyme (TIGR03279 family)|nr:DUF512 domain-containing protein [Thermodesulfobacteriota bacterium]
MLKITDIYPESIAEEMELEVGDALVSIDGKPVRDLLDYALYCGRRSELILDVLRRDGEQWELHIEREPHEDLGMEFEHPDPRQCGNNCIFCFVHQLPRGMRRTLYIKDEDYRFSFLYGSYITLTNLSEDDFDRIVEQHLSPLFVSVHATDDELRNRLLGAQAPSIMPLLRRLTGAGIEIHTQIVVCPGINDGRCLEQTIEDLHSLAPAVLSLAVVPVGLTGHRERLPELRVPTTDEARQIIDRVEGFQKRFLESDGSRFVFAADELYLKAGRDIPELAEYEDLPQWENGVGMLALFRAEAAKALACAEPLELQEVSVVTGESAAAQIREYAAHLSERTGVEISVYPIRNRFFGGQVTVAGLLTGADILAQLEGQPLGQALFVPDALLREGQDILLDDVTLSDLEEDLGVPVEKISADPWGLLSGLEVMNELLNEKEDS